MNVQGYSDQRLWVGTLERSKNERRALTDFLHHLVEVERRKLFSEHKFTSIFDFLTRGLNYSEDEAHSRVVAMRLMRELPAVEQKLRTGRLNLTNIRLAQRLFSKERKSGNVHSKESKEAILQRLEGKSTREAEKVIKEIRPDMGRDRGFSFADVHDELLREKLLAIRGELAHTDPELTLNELLHKLCDSYIERNGSSVSDQSVARQVHSDTSNIDVHSEAAARRAVWARDQRKCVNCGSNYAVQIDHVVPRAAGGQSTLENMRLLCRNCNLRAAIQFYGRRKMSRHMPN